MDSQAVNLQAMSSLHPPEGMLGYECCRLCTELKRIINARPKERAGSFLASAPACVPKVLTLVPAGLPVRAAVAVRSSLAATPQSGPAQSIRNLQLTIRYACSESTVYAVQGTSCPHAP